MKHFSKFVPCLLTALLLCSCASTTVSPDSVPNFAVTTPTPSPTPIPVSTVEFSASGDNLIHGSIYLQARTESGYDFAPLYANVAAFYQQYDLNFINQETLVNNSLSPSTYPCFSTPGELGKAAYDVGFRLFGGANNHTYDKGSAGISATLRYWESMPADALYFGLYKSAEDSEAVKLYTKNGITFACLAYTDMTNGLPTPYDAEAHVIYTNEEDLIAQQLTQARRQADVVLVSVHWGVEDSHTVTQAQKTFAQKLADWGADIIIGTHPHVIQPVEWIAAQDGRQTLCAYSLGNFVSAQSRPDELFGYVLTCTFEKMAATPCTISNVKIHPTITHYDAKFSNIRVWMLSDYPADKIQNHGARSEYPYFTLDYINSSIEKIIAPEFLA